MGDSRQKMRAAWLAVADACESVDDDTWEDCAATVLAVMDDAIDAPSKVGFTWADTAAAIRAMCGPDEDEAPPADVSLLALANRTLTADLEAARADVERVTRRAELAEVRRAELRAALGGTEEDVTLPPVEHAAKVRRERDEARAEVDRADSLLTSIRNELRPAGYDAVQSYPDGIPVCGYVLPLDEQARRCAAAVARLTRILAVERGDQTQAPAGWKRYGDAAWRIPGPGGVVIQRACDGMLDTWIRRGVLRDDPRCRVWPTALEAMEAIDAERGGVSDG